MVSQPKVLVVDLEKSLLKTGLLEFQSVQLVLNKPRIIVEFIRHLLKGSSAFKWFVASKWPLDFDTISIRNTAMEVVHKYKASGAEIILVSELPEIWVKAIAEKLNCFDLYFGLKEADLKKKIG